ncbi:MAG: hypothetical protein KatS3mg068_0889 [Candidatus Sericytochromatia bacterium]|nr:MAG: hypothetical protein KatS3mg068_0889 [Candidatus Sericytochromatia bacterium]
MSKLFDDLKEKYGRDIFGQGWLYRIVSQNEIANVDELTEEEKTNGIKGNKTFVPYDKGDKDGNRWYSPTPYYIDWSVDNVRFLKNDKKARWQGYNFYFKEGFCWNLINGTRSTNDLKFRLVEKSVYDVGSMRLISLLEKIDNKIIVSLINSKINNNFSEQFMNFSVNFQINDARQLPIIIPNQEQKEKLENIFNRAYNIQKKKFSGEMTEKNAKEELDKIQNELDIFVERMYLGD